jgi:hypothetical protein
MEKTQDRTAPSELQEPGGVLEALARKGARQLLAQAMEAEVAEFVEKHSGTTDEEGRRVVVRNGHLPERELVTGIGPLKIRQPRVDDRVLDQDKRFSSQILPRYLRRVASVDNLIPILYLKGISSGDMSEALQSILGPGVAGLSATNIVRLKALWEQDYASWSARDFELKRYVYFWVDGIHFNVRLDGERSCILVIMGANESGRKELLAVSDGYAESKASWREVLLDLKRREDRAEAGRRGRGAGILGGSSRGLSWESRATLLGAQNSERPGQDAQERAGQGQGHAARDVAGTHKGEGAGGLRAFCDFLAREVSQGGGLPAGRQGGTVRLLRFPRHALGSHQDNQPYRVDLRNRETAHQEDQGVWLADGDADDGIQAGLGSGEDLAAAYGAQTNGVGNARPTIRRR